MNGHRRPGAPRLIEWTGERCVPWAPDVQVVYEHLHRYLWAAQWVEGLRVLDLASGEGFGAAILADRAASVVGVDIDPLAVEHSRLNYDSPRLEFEVADALDLRRLPAEGFDVVVAFEMVEHLADHDALLGQIRRVLRPGGLLIISTPDRDAYRAARSEKNPYHVHELTIREFGDLLRGHFANLWMWGQSAVEGSAMHQLEDAALRASTGAVFVERDGDDWRRVELDSPVYLVAIASDAELPGLPGDSVLADPGLALSEAVRSNGYRRESDLVQQLARQDFDLSEARRQIDHLRESLASLQTEYAQSIQLTRRVEESITWNAFQRLRQWLFSLMGGEGSRPVEVLQSTLRALGGRRQLEHKRRLVVFPARLSSLMRERRLEFPRFEAPEVSIVIPVFRRADLTRRCLVSILDHTSAVPYEVILIDDVSDAGNRRLLAALDGAKVIVNTENMGYLRSVNRAVAEARGRWIVLANNDIEVQPGWLEALVRCGDSGDDIAVVTPRYVYPDGSLNEAGGIIWSDGTGANYGRGDHANSWRYGYRRDVDYGSAAALLVRADFWRERGGYDETFLPMYYEDTDLCFDARQRGLRVVYEPEAIVVHHEGGTAGTDLGTGYKRHQEENRRKFVAKWERCLSAHLPPEHPVSPASLRRQGELHVLIVDHRLPKPDHDSGSLRMQTIIEILTQAGCRVTFLPDNLEALRPYADRLARLGVGIIHGPDDPVEELMDLGRSVDVAVLSRADVAARWLAHVKRAAPQAMTVYDTVDLHWLREARRYWHEHGSESVDIGPRASELRERELGLVRDTDVTLVVSEDERQRVELDVPGSDVRVIPNIHRVSMRVPSRLTRSGLLFVGGFEHPPNIEAVVRLVDRVMPRVWETLPDLDVTIVGADAPEEIRRLSSERVRIAGWVPDIEPLLDASVAMLAPLSYGAGVKGKVTQAMAAGLPVVTTPIGAEGLEAQSGEHLLVGEDDAELARAVLRLVEDPELWEQLSRSGRELISQRFSVETVRSRLSALLGVRRDMLLSA